MARAGDLLKAEGLTIAHEPLATLGDSLALCRVSVAASGISSGRFDVGAYESEQIALIEADAHGQRRRAEFFADDRLSDAVARLYERYADLLPDGPAREHAAATARSVAVLLGPVDPDRYAAALAPAVEFVDHRRPVGFGSARGAEAVLQGLRTGLSLVIDPIYRVDDLLGLRSDAALLRSTASGTDRASGGAYENHYFQVWTFGADGLATRIEWFNRDNEALARFDALTAAPGARAS